VALYLEAHPTATPADIARAIASTATAVQDNKVRRCSSMPSLRPLEGVQRPPSYDWSRDRFTDV